MCGDPHDLVRPRPHEVGGRFARGVVGRVLRAGGEVDVAVELLQHQMGHFVFELCPYNSNCEDPLVLKVIGNDGKDKNAYKLPKRNALKELHRIKLRIPDSNVTAALGCEDKCVLRWRYAMETHLWPCLRNGTLNHGCGPQPEARACADVRIWDQELDEDAKKGRTFAENDDAELVNENYLRSTMLLLKPIRTRIQIEKTINLMRKHSKRKRRKMIMKQTLILMILKKILMKQMQILIMFKIIMSMALESIKRRKAKWKHQSTWKQALK